MRKLLFILLLFFYIKAEAQTMNQRLIISSGLNFSTMFYNRNRLNFTPFPFLNVAKDLVKFRNGIVSVGLNYTRKGGNEGLLIIDTNVWQSYYGDNLKYLNLNYVGVGLSYRKNIFRGPFYYELGFRLNYLLSGKKYNYQYNYVENQLTTEVNSIFDLNNEPFYKYKPIRFENAMALNVSYKLPFIRKSYLSLGYERGLTSVFLYDKRINHGLLVGLKVCM